MLFVVLAGGVFATSLYSVDVHEIEEGITVVTVCVDESYSNANAEKELELQMKNVARNQKRMIQGFVFKKCDSSEEEAIPLNEEKNLSLAYDCSKEEIFYPEEY